VARPDPRRLGGREQPGLGKPWAPHSLLGPGKRFGARASVQRTVIVREHGLAPKLPYYGGYQAGRARHYAINAFATHPT